MSTLEDRGFQSFCDVASHPFHVSKDQAEGLALMGIMGCLGGGAIAAAASLFGFPRVAKLGGIKAAIGVGVAVTGFVLSDRVKERTLVAAAKSQPLGV